VALAARVGCDTSRRRHLPPGEDARVTPVPGTGSGPGIGRRRGCRGVQWGSAPPGSRAAIRRRNPPVRPRRLPPRPGDVEVVAGDSGFLVPVRLRVLRQHAVVTGDLERRRFDRQPQGQTPVDARDLRCIRSAGLPAWR
jgi:hypothetical protein